MKEILSPQSSQSPPLTDGALVAKSLEGDKLAFGLLIDRYWEVLAILIYNRLRNHADTDDVLQESFIKAYKKLPSLRDGEKFGPWLYHIGFTTSIDWLRKEKRHTSLSLDEIREEVAFEKPKKVDSPLEEYVVKAVQSLPEKYQVVVTLRYFKGLSYQEIAAHLGEPTGTIGNRLHRANKLLKEWMDWPQDDTR